MLRSLCACIQDSKLAAANALKLTDEYLEHEALLAMAGQVRKNDLLLHFHAQSVRSKFCTAVWALSHSCAVCLFLVAQSKIYMGQELPEALSQYFKGTLLCSTSEMTGESTLMALLLSFCFVTTQGLGALKVIVI